jgi:opacity protein-like surface antigen
MKTLLAVMAALAIAAPAAAQMASTEQTRRPLVSSSDPPSVSIRGFGTAAVQKFSAKNSFEAVFGQSVEPFFGGGVQVVFRPGLFVEAAVSRFEKTGQRAFRNNGQNFGLGIPLTARITPVEFTAGWRNSMEDHDRVILYAGAGVGRYYYKESSKETPSSSMYTVDLDVDHIGYLAVVGVEFRVHRWIGLSGDAQYTHVTGILGSAGISADASEKDLGGIAARFRVIVGR